MYIALYSHFLFLISDVFAPLLLFVYLKNIIFYRPLLSIPHTNLAVLTINETIVHMFD